MVGLPGASREVATLKKAKPQHRYTQYALAHGCEPDVMFERDRVRWPGGCMAGFMQWSSLALRAFAAEHNCKAFRDVKMLLGDVKTHRVYDAWLVVNRGRFVETE